MTNSSTVLRTPFGKHNANVARLPPPHPNSEKAKRQLLSSKKKTPRISNRSNVRTTRRREKTLDVHNETKTKRSSSSLSVASSKSKKSLAAAATSRSVRSNNSRNDGSSSKQQHYPKHTNNVAVSYLHNQTKKQVMRRHPADDDDDNLDCDSDEESLGLNSPKKEEWVLEPPSSKQNNKKKKSIPLVEDLVKDGIWSMPIQDDDNVVDDAKVMSAMLGSSSDPMVGATLQVPPLTTNEYPSADESEITIRSFEHHSDKNHRHSQVSSKRRHDEKDISSSSRRNDQQRSTSKSQRQDKHKVSTTKATHQASFTAQTKVETKTETNSTANNNNTHNTNPWASHPPLPPGWVIRVSKSKNKIYYVHPDFGSSWYPPVVLPKLTQQQEPTKSDELEERQEEEEEIKRKEEVSSKQERLHQDEESEQQAAQDHQVPPPETQPNGEMYYDADNESEETTSLHENHKVPSQGPSPGLVVVVDHHREEQNYQDHEQENYHGQEEANYQDQEQAFSDDQDGHNDTELEEATETEIVSTAMMAGRKQPSNRDSVCMAEEKADEKAPQQDEQSPGVAEDTRGDVGMDDASFDDFGGNNDDYQDDRRDEYDNLDHEGEHKLQDENYSSLESPPRRRTNLSPTVDASSSVDTTESDRLGASCRLESPHAASHHDDIMDSHDDLTGNVSDDSSSLEYTSRQGRRRSYGAASAAVERRRPKYRLSLRVTQPRCRLCSLQRLDEIMRANEEVLSAKRNNKKKRTSVKRKKPTGRKQSTKSVRKRLKY